MVSDTEPTVASASMVQIQIQLGTLQGTINTLLSELGRRVDSQVATTSQLRADLTAVKDNGVESVNLLRQSVTQNSSSIDGLKSDMEEVKEKQNSSTQRAVLVISPVIAIAGLVWGIIGDKV
jgi:hypothetical protein